MKLLILQLSDIHLTGDNDPIMGRVEALRGAVQAEALDIDSILVAVTGDLVDRGRERAYEVAGHFLTEVAEALNSVKNGGVPVQWAFIPGNHDCTLDRADQARNIFIDALLKDPQRLTTLDSSVLSPVLTVQDPFFEFVAQWRGAQGGDEDPFDRLCDDRMYRFGEQRIFVRSLNSSWMSQINEMRGSLLVWMRPMPDCAEDANLKIALVHHPYAWLETKNSTSVKHDLERCFDLILTGHEHVAEAYNKRSIRSTANEYFEGAALQGHPREESGFTIVVVDTHSRKFRTVLYSWDGFIYRSELRSDWGSLNHRALSGPSRFAANLAFEAHLVDPGATYTHPHKVSLQLDDLFVYPDLRDVSYDRRDGDPDRRMPFDGRDIVARVLLEKAVLLLGAEMTGKSTLLRKLFRDLQHEGLVPVLLEGDDLKKSDSDHIMKSVRRRLSEQYSREASEQILQQPIDKRAILVDNFQDCKLNRKGLRSALSAMRQLADVVVFAAIDTYNLEDFLKEGEDSSGLAAFRHYSICEFGHRLRSSLVRRWVMAGREESLEDAEVTHSCRTLETLLSTLIGKNTVPAVPIFLLTLLQAHEAQKPLSTEVGSFGYHYEFLISTSLHAAIASDSHFKSTVRFDMAQVVLQEIAHTMFERAETRMTEAELDKAIQDYKEDYALSFGTDVMKGLLLKSRMIKREGEGRFRFAYPYIYFFFVARALQARLADEKREMGARGAVDRLVESIHVEERLNILVFLVYLTKDSRVIDSIVEKASAIFQKVPPCNLDTHTAHVGGEGLDDEKVIDGTPETNREQYLRDLDEADETMRREPEEYDPEDFFSQLNVAAKYVQILGQVLRNFPGSLDGATKVRIAEETCGLGLRTMNVVVNLMRLIDAEIRRMIENYLIERRKVGNPIEARDAVNRAIADVTSGWCYSVVSRISGAIGSDLLEEVYRKISDGDTPIPKRLIRLKVFLDHFKQFPVDEIVAADQAFAGKPVPRTIVRMMVYEHLYMFNVPQRVRQSMADQLKIRVDHPAVLGRRTKKI